MTQVHATIAHRGYDLDSDAVESALRGVTPDPIDDHFVVVGGRRFPPKQVLSLVTGLDRADFNTHHARDVLRRLGFTVSRRSHAAAAGRGEAPAGRLPEAEALRPFRGKWVAQRGVEVLVAADTPQEVLAWLEQHNQHAGAMFRVPLDERDAAGLAPQ